MRTFNENTLQSCIESFAEYEATHFCGYRPDDEVEVVVWSVDDENSGLGMLCLTLQVSLDWTEYRGEYYSTGIPDGWELTNWNIESATIHADGCEGKIIIPIHRAYEMLKNFCDYEIRTNYLLGYGTF